MKLLILLFTISRLCECSLLVQLAEPVPVQYHGVTVGITPYSAPVNSHSQYLAQDSYGHYAYGYTTDHSAQDEVKTADGVTRGGYSYIDANGILQTVQYISDPVHGFRVAATNLPKDLPEVAAARAQHLAQFEYIKAEHAAISASRAHLPAVISPVPAPGAYVVPVKAADLVVPGPALGPAVAPVAFTPPVITISSQYQAQDGHGQYSYGYADPNSAKSETKTADGVTRGGYSYIDANGVLQTVQYVSDPVNGFRVAASNLPQAPSVTLIGPKVTATVVGPKDNNAAAVAVAPDAVIAPAVSAVPVQTHIDSIGVEQRPVFAQADIVVNANVPLVNPVGPVPYIHPNPNHEPVAVLPNHELPAPFHTGAADAPVPPQYAPFPYPTHGQAVLHNQQPVYAAAPALGNISPEYASGYPIPHPDGGAVIAPHHPNQVLQAPLAHTPEYYPIAPEHRGQISVDSNHGPIPAQYAAAHRADIYANPNIQVPHDYEALISGSRGQYLTEDPRAYGINVDPHTQISSHEPIRVRVLNANPHTQIYGEDGRGQILAADPRGQTISGDPRGHYLADGNLQALGDPNGHHAAHPITLNPHEVAPSPDYRANYQLPVGPINADTINNGPINQQVLNHGEGSGPARVAFFVPDAAAQQVHKEAAASAVRGSGGGQVAHPEQQAFIVRVAEHESADTDGITPPSGYYTQNIQY